MSHARLARIGQVLCLAGAAVGALGLAGWLIRPDLLALPPGRPMMPNTALGLLLLGLGAAASRTSRVGVRACSQVITLVVIAFSVVTLVEYAFHVDLRIDQIIPSVYPGPYPGRSSPPSVIALLLLGVALLTFDVRPAARWRPSEWFAVLAATVASTALTGLIFNVGELDELTHGAFLGVALPASIAVLLIVAGMLLERPTAGMMRVILSASPGGTVVRGVIPLAIAGPIGLGLVVVWVASKLDVGGELSFVMPMLAAALTVLALVWTTAIAAALDRMHRALEASRARTSDLVEHAPDGIFVADRDGYYTDVNAAGARMLGCTREAIIGKHVRELLPPEDLERLTASTQRMLAGETVVEEWLLRRHDGAPLPVEISARFLADGRWQGVVRDITERKRLEREQRLLAEIGRVVAETLDHDETVASITSFAVRHLADICVLDLVAEGELSRTVVPRDPARRGPCELLSKGPIDPAHPLMIEAVLASRRTFFMEDVDQATVALVHGKQNQRAWLALEPRSIIAIPLLRFDRLLGAVTLVTSAGSRPFDLADVRLAEAFAQVAALSIESAMLYRTSTRAVCTRDEVLAIVAHDLRNPLNTIDLQAEMLRQDGLGQAADVIGRAVARMNRLIQDLLDVTRLEAGALSLEKRRVSATQLAIEAVETERSIVESAHLAIELDLADDLPDVVADRDRIQQVLENLIGNAVKFTGRGGRITIGARARDREVLFCVTDTGAGIPAKDLPHLFDRFWQARKRSRGAGLGLAIVKGLVEEHGGRIWVESTPGSGSAFYFTIPAAPRVGRAMDAHAP